MRVTESTVKAMLEVGSVDKIDVVRRENEFNVCLTKKSGGAVVLGSARQKVRSFKSLDTVDRFLKSVGVGSYSVI